MYVGNSLKGTYALQKRQLPSQTDGLFQRLSPLNIRWTKKKEGEWLCSSYLCRRNWAVAEEAAGLIQLDAAGVQCPVPVNAWRRIVADRFISLSKSLALLSASSSSFSWPHRFISPQVSSLFFFFFRLVRLLNVSTTYSTCAGGVPVKKNEIRN